MAKTLEQIQAELETLKTQFTDFSALSPVSYYTHQYSGEEIDQAVTRALPNGAIDQAVGTLVRPNLLDNWYFGRPVNQRGMLEWTAANSYTIDRWKRAGSGKVSFVDGGIKCEDVYLHQFFEKGFLGKGTYTISVLTKNPSGVFTGVFGFWGAGVDKSFSVALDNGFATTTFTVTANHDDFNPFIYLGLQNTFLAAKLELGPTQTLARQENGQWVLNDVPDYGEQLARCQRYFRRIKPAQYAGFARGCAYNANSVRVMIPFETMRTSPSLNLNNASGIFATNGATGDVFGLSFSGVWTTPESVTFDASKTGAFVDGKEYILRGDLNSYIDAISDL